MAWIMGRSGDSSGGLHVGGFGTHAADLLLRGGEGNKYGYECCKLLLLVNTGRTGEMRHHMLDGID